MTSHTCKTLTALATLTPCLSFAALSSNETVATALLSNPSDYARHDEIIAFDLHDLGLRPGDDRSGSLVARSAGIDVPSQSVDDDGDGSPDRFLALLDFKPGQERSLSIEVDPVAARATAFPKRTQAEISRKVGGTWNDRVYEGGEWMNVQSLTPPAAHTDHSFFIRYEGPGIESDKVGYRVYLDWRNGFDIFSKTKTELALHQVGLDNFDSYHEMADWGMDTLKVGDSLGMGGYGYWNGESVERVSEVDGWDASILQNGAIQSSFKIKYKGWEVADKKIDLDATLSMTAGSRLVHVQLEYSEMLDNIAMGLVDHGVDLIEGNRDVSRFGGWSYIATWGKQSLNEDNLGMAIFFRNGTVGETFKGEHNQLAIGSSGDNRYDYYFCSAWELEENGIKTKKDFIAYLDRQAEKLMIPIRQEVTTALDLVNQPDAIDAQVALDYAIQMSESEMKRLGYGLALGNYDPDRERPANWTYTTGLLMQAIDDTSEAANRADMRSYADKVMDSFIEEDGTISGYKIDSYNIDMINSGKYLLRLWQRTGEEKYKIASDTLRAQLVDHPRTSEGAFWHKQIYPGQLWLDGVYMGMPFLAHYSALFENGSAWEESVHEFDIARKHLRDSETGLYYHGWDELKEQAWANKKTGLSQEVWARGLGWYSMALVDILDFIPENKPELRKSIIDMIGETAKSLVEHQDDETGVWYQIVNKPDELGNYTESSASSMFVYLLTKAINKGYLSDEYKAAAIEGYEGLIDQFITHHADGSLSLKDVCKVAGLGFGRDGSYKYYMTEEIIDNGPHGVGPFIMASVEMSKLLAK